MPIVEPSRAGLTISGSPSSATTRIQSVARVDDAILRRRNAAREPDELRAPLVHRQRRRHHAAAGVGNLQRLQRALHGAVLAEAAVQRDEDAREAVALQVEDVALGRIERMRVHALLAQRRQDAIAGHQRHLALRGRTAQQHRDFAEFGRSLRSCRSPTMRTSCSSSTPVFARTVSRTKDDQRLDVGRLRLAVRIDDEVGVLLGDPRAADRVALEAARLDQSRGMVVRRVAEHAARVGQVERLRQDPLRQQFPDAVARRVARRLPGKRNHAAVNIPPTLPAVPRRDALPPGAAQRRLGTAAARGPSYAAVADA